MITVGAQLMVGTVFSRLLPLDNDQEHTYWTQWSNVDVWCKYRVDDLSRLDNMYLSINDRSGNSSSASIPVVDPGNNNVWRVAYHTNGTWTNWDDKNLRVVMTFLGTTTPANVGLVTVDVEYFAIRLRNQEDYPQ